MHTNPIHTTETELADIFAREFQAHPPGTSFEPVMRSIARQVAGVLHPDSAERRNAFLDAANMSGLFIDR